MKDYEKIVEACKVCTSRPGCDGCPYENEECYDTFKKDVLDPHCGNESQT